MNLALDVYDFAHIFPGEQIDFDKWDSRFGDRKLARKTRERKWSRIKKTLRDSAYNDLLEWNKIVPRMGHTSRRARRWSGATATIFAPSFRVTGQARAMAVRVLDAAQVASEEKTMWRQVRENEVRRAATIHMRKKRREWREDLEFSLGIL